MDEVIEKKMDETIAKTINERKEKIINMLKEHVYPTSQTLHGQKTVDEYINSVADHFSNEVFARRMLITSLPLFAELAVIRHALGEWKY